MRSFYGGKQGFGFILRGNTAAEDNLFHNEEEILAAIREQRLNYGEYVLLSSPDENNLDKLGNLYRIVEDGIEKVAQISGPRGPQGIQGVPGEAGPKGEQGVGVVYREIETPDLAPSLYSVITFEKAEGMPALEVDETALVVDAFYEENGTQKQKESYYSLTKTDFSQWGYPNTERRQYLNKIAAYDIKLCLEKAQHEDPFIAVYKGGLLPPAIFIHNTFVKFRGKKLKMSGDMPVLENDDLVIENPAASVTLQNGFYIVTTHGAVVPYQWSQALSMQNAGGITYRDQIPNLIWLFRVNASSTTTTIQDYFDNPVFLYGKYNSDREAPLLPFIDNTYIEQHAVTFPWSIREESTYDYQGTVLENDYPGIIWNDNTMFGASKMYAPGFSSVQEACSRCNYPGFRWGRDFFDEFGRQWTKILKISDE